jgi:hypothetical protein
MEVADMSTKRRDEEARIASASEFELDDLAEDDDESRPLHQGR